jgi:hypothetical protein
MKMQRLVAFWALTIIVVCPAVFGQRMFGGGPRNYGSEQLAKIFGQTDAFTAVAETTIQDKKHGTPIQMEVAYAFLKGKLRTEMDLSKMKGPDMPADASEQMKQMGMDKTVNIYNTATRTMYLMYPGLKAYCEMTPPNTAGVTNEPPKFEITNLGKETIDGHACEKNKITVLDKDGASHDIIAWQATDLNKFPIKTEMTESGSTITTHFRAIELSAPAASLFEPPANFKRYGSIQEMMMSSMQQMMQGMPSHGQMPHRGGMPPQGGEGE